MLSFSDQLERKHEIKGSHEEQKAASPTYKDFEGEPIGKYIIDNYVIPMVRAQEQEDNKKLKEIKRKFIRFSAKALFFTDILDLCRAIEDKEINTNLADS